MYECASAMSSDCVVLPLRAKNDWVPLRVAYTGTDEASSAESHQVRAATA